MSARTFSALGKTPTVGTSFVLDRPLKTKPGSALTGTIRTGTKVTIVEILNRPTASDAVKDRMVTAKVASPRGITATMIVRPAHLEA